VYRAFIAGQAASVVDRNYLSHAADLLAFTRENLARAGVDPDRENVRFVKGLYEKTLVIDSPVAFAHIDCDWYDSVSLCIARIRDHVNPGGVLLFDDYNSFQGCRKAVDEWLAGDPRFRIIHADWTVAVQRQPDTAS
jgi:hypothetical protein